MLLYLGYEKLNWSKGIHLNNVKQEWRDVLNVAQRYITCEGRFATVFRYHLRFLLHLNRESRLNLPYYMFKSLEKMVTRGKNHLGHTVTLFFITS